LILLKLETKYLELSDISLAYSEYGEGPDLILLHGNSESKSIFRKYQTSFFSMFHTYAIDSRGHGESISNDDSLSINQFSDDVIQFCKKLDIREAYIIGYSDGGNIALFLALKEPQLFTKLVAISPNYLMSGTVDSALTLFESIKKLLITFGSIGINTKKWIMRMNLMLSDIGITDEDLKTIRTRFYIIYAQNDLIKEEHIQKINSLIPESTIQKISVCTHFSILTKKETIREIEKYLMG
jgi:pimeloyl-ACP methyl ester carboxylesterase